MRYSLWRLWQSAPLLLAAGGCVSPFTTRLPTIEPGIPQVERRAYEIHDPFPDSDLGPETQVRPRGFVEQRSEPRRILEGRALLDLAPERIPVDPGLPPSSWNYSQAVPP